MPKANGSAAATPTKPAPSASATPAAAAAEKKPRRSSKQGDAVFAAFLAVFGALMLASFNDLIPVMEFEHLSANEAEAWAQWMIDNTWLPFFLSGLYIVMVFGGQWYMADKKPMDLRTPLALWSLLLALFSIAGALRTVPVMFQILNKRGVMHLVCGDTRFEWLTVHPAGYWTLLFCLSKVPELIDTVFIVLRKKPVMLFCWQSWTTCCVNGLIFASMNLTVHSIMYFFYFCTAWGLRPTSFAPTITLGQISQMVVGTAVTLFVTMDKLVWHPVKLDLSMTIPKWFYTKEPIPDGGPCHVSSGNALAGFVMYGSYLALFMDFFYKAYLKPGAKGERGE